MRMVDNADGMRVFDLDEKMAPTIVDGAKFWATNIESKDEKYDILLLIVADAFSQSVEVLLQSP